jgi:peptidyl-tRNA hydrolase, PTH1 family
MEQPFDLNNIRLIVGLGNVGNDYANTRHNAGFIFVDSLIRAWQPQLNWSKNSDLQSEIVTYKPNSERSFVLAKPTTMMNLSGQAVSKLLNYYKLTPDNLLLAHDDLDLALGQTRLQFSRGPKDHNGILSVENYLGTNAFWRLRIGVDAREVRGNKGIPGERYSLERFKAAEREVLDTQIQETISRYFALI